MGVKAEQRYAAKSARDFHEEVERMHRDPWRLLSIAQGSLVEAREEIASLRAQNAALESSLKRAEVRIRERASTLTCERIEHAEALTVKHGHYMDAVRAMFRFKRSWERLSRIVRVGMTPTQFHEARESLGIGEI